MYSMFGDPLGPNPRPVTNPLAPSLSKPGGGMEWHNAAGRVHSEHDAPALISENGDLLWFSDGILNRGNDRPALVTMGSQGNVVTRFLRPRTAIDIIHLTPAAEERINYWTRQTTRAVSPVPFKLEWYEDGRAHRRLGPAVIWNNVFPGQFPSWIEHGNRVEKARARRLHRAYTATRMTDAEAWELADNDTWVMLLLCNNPRISLEPRTQSFFMLASMELLPPRQAA